LKSIEQSDFVLIIGEDLTQTSPRIALSIRQALRNASIEKASSIGVKYWQDSAVRTYGGELLTPLFSLNSLATKLDDVAEIALIITPDNIEKCVTSLTMQLANLIDFSLDSIGFNQQEEINTEKLTDQHQAFIKALMPALLKARKPLITTGWSLQSASLLHAIKQLMKVLQSEQFRTNNSAPQLAVIPPQCNSVGLMLLTDEKTLSTKQVIEKLANNEADSVICLEQELTHFSDRQIEELREHAKTIIVLDHSESRLSKVADVVMPVSAISEANGHYVNYQGCAQRYYQVHAPVLPIQDSWRWLNLFEEVLLSQQTSDENKQTQYSSKVDKIQTLEQLVLILGFGDNAHLLQTNSQGEGIARQTHRTSGRTSQMANITVHEAKTTQSRDATFNFSMEGLTAGTSAEMPFTWAPGWNSNQSISHFQTDAAGALEKALDQQFLAFDDATQLLQAWPVNDIKVPFNKRESNDNEIVFVQQVLMAQAEWQASFNPEFTQVFQGNSLSVSPHYAKQQGWQTGQYVKVIISADDSNIEQIKDGNLPFQLATLNINNQLADNLVNANIFELANHLTNLSQRQVKITEAETQEIAHHQQSEQARSEQAELEKKQVLERLKIGDQTIPIRLVSGGLEDV